MKSKEISGVSMRWQIIFVIAVGLYVCSLHWNNDGLWYQGDSPRHAANGVFWKDYLTSLSLHPVSYAFAFYARYPVITPTSYPPLFYLAEAFAFSLLGPSPYVAKAIVLFFALIAAIFSTFWLRRWIAPEAGWGGAIVLASPGVVMWSHAVMLNVPAFALSLAALYSVRRWLEPGKEDSSVRWGYASVALFTLAALTYYPSLIVALIGVAWLVYLRRWDLSYGWRILTVAAIALFVLIPCLFIAWRWSPRIFRWLNPPWSVLQNRETWTYYLLYYARLVDPCIGFLALAGVLIGLMVKRWRKETGILAIWILLIYAVFSYIEVRDSRYLLLAITPLVCLAMIALIGIADWATTYLPQRKSLPRALRLLPVLAATSVQLWSAGWKTVPSIDGFKQAASFFSAAAPDESVLYVGRHDGMFTFYVLAADPDYRRQVMLAERIWSSQTEAANSNVVNTVRTIGTRWVAIEVNDQPSQSKPADSLRQAIADSQFELVRSFPIQNIGRIDLYRALFPVERTDSIEMSIPDVGHGVPIRVKPLSRFSR